MQLEEIVRIPYNKVTTDDVCEVYKIFLQAYKIEFPPQKIEDDQDDIRRAFEFEKGDLLLRPKLANTSVDYRPYMGAKFFVQINRKDIHFHGYSASLNPWGEGRVPKWYKKEKERLHEQQEKFAYEFQRKVKEYFKDKI